MSSDKVRARESGAWHALPVALLAESIGDCTAAWRFIRILYYSVSLGAPTLLACYSHSCTLKALLLVGFRCLLVSLVRIKTTNARNPRYETDRERKCAASETDLFEKPESHMKSFRCNLYRQSRGCRPAVRTESHLDAKALTKLYTRILMFYFNQRFSFLNRNMKNSFLCQLCKYEKFVFMSIT